MIRRVYIIPIGGTQDGAQLNSERIRVGNIFDTARQKVIINRNTEAGEMTMDVMANIATFADLDDSAKKYMAVSTSATAPLRVPTQSPLDNSTKAASTAYVDAAVTAGATDNLSTVLGVGNSATGQNITTLQQIYNTVASKQNTLYLDSTNALQMYMAGVNVNSNWLIKGETNAGTTLPTISISVYDILGGTPYVTGMTVAKNAITISGTLTGTFPGAVYDADYSANYTSRSLIDKGYAAATYSPIAGSASIVTVGTIATGTWNASLIGLAYGGTNKNMTAVNGGVVYTDADSMEVTAAGSAGQILRSAGAAAPVWSTPTFPNSATSGKVLQGDGTNIVLSAYTLPTAAGGTGTILRSDGTNYVATTNTFPNTAGANEVLYATAANVIGSSSTFLSNGTQLVINKNAITAGYVLDVWADAAGVSYPFRTVSDSTGRSFLMHAKTNAAAGTGYGIQFGLVEGASTTNNISSFSNVSLGTQTAFTIIASSLTLPDKTFINGTAQLAAEVFGVQKNQNAATYGLISNTTSNTAAYAALVVTNSATLATYSGIFALSAAYTTSGIFVQDTLTIMTTKAAGMNVGTNSNTQLSFWTNNTKRGEFVATGGFAAYAQANTSSTSNTVTFTSAHYGLAYLWSPTGTATATLPANGAAAGSWFDVYLLTDQTITISAATADTLITVNDTAADSVAFSTAGQKIGSMVRFISNGSVWIAVNLGTNTMTVAT